MITVWGPLGGFTISMKISLYGGITLALPFILYFVADFVLPALKKNEKLYFKRAFAIGGGLFLLGMALCYFVMLRISLVGLDQYNKWVGLEGDMWRAGGKFLFLVLF